MLLVFKFCFALSKVPFVLQTFQKNFDHSESDFDDLNLLVSISNQEMQLFSGTQLLRCYPISTSKFGIGFEEGSFQTPMGNFQICEKFGDDLPEFSILKGRLPTGELAPLGGEADHVLTRIFWLEGLEEKNANTKQRYIYIHGTNQEEEIGHPASHGCVRMCNRDIVELYERVPVGTKVRIVR
ncbi:MAG: L,D-transpeptidase family protein [Chthoniobacterales bacterium]